MQEITNIEYLTNNDFNLKEDLNNSQIYKITNKTNGKYILDKHLVM